MCVYIYIYIYTYTCMRDQMLIEFSICFSRSWDLNPQIRTLVKSNQ